MLAIYAERKYGTSADRCYVCARSLEARLGNLEVVSEMPPVDGYWTIYRPTELIKAHYEGSNCELRTYGGQQYLLSPKASESISLAGSGALGVLSFDHDSIKYYIFVVDKKEYVQNPMGTRNAGETDRQNLRREIKEELGVDTDETQYEVGGYYDFTTKNSLIGSVACTTHTDFFYVHVTFEQVAHLVTKPLREDELNIFRASEYPFKLDETEYVIIASERMVSEYPSEHIELEKSADLVQHSWNGHHREFVLRPLGLSRYDLTSYGPNFDFVFF